jgi:hypothetical protein
MELDEALKILNVSKDVSKEEIAQVSALSIPPMSHALLYSVSRKCLN